MVAGIHDPLRSGSGARPATGIESVSWYARQPRSFVHMRKMLPGYVYALRLYKCLELAIIR